MLKLYDQHFLVDSRVIKRIVDYADVNDTEVILEIGAGTGNLTKALAEKAAKVIAIESSYRLVKALRNLGLSSVDIMHGDALKVDFPKFDKVISNLPYSISSAITFKLLKHDFKLGILMYQYEFARRMVATPGTKDYSRLSVGVQYFAKVEILEMVPKTAFYPQPEVTSAIVRITPEPPSLVVLNREFFFNFVTAVFTQRRKQMRNAINTFARMMNLDVNSIINVLPGDLMHKRPETLSPEDLAGLSNLIYEAVS